MSSFPVKTQTKLEEFVPLYHDGLHPQCHRSAVETCVEPSHLAFVAAAIANFERLGSLRQTVWTRARLEDHIGRWFGRRAFSGLLNAVDRYRSIRNLWHGRPSNDRTGHELVLRDAAVDYLLHDWYADHNELKFNASWDAPLADLKDWVDTVPVESPAARTLLQGSMLYFAVKAMLALSSEQWDGRTIYLADLDKDDDTGFSLTPVGFWIDGLAGSPEPRLPNKYRLLDWETYCDPARRYARPDDPDVHGDLGRCRVLRAQRHVQILAETAKLEKKVENEDREEEKDTLFTIGGVSIFDES